MALGASTTGRQAAGPTPSTSRRRRADLVTVLCLAVVVAAVVVRIAFATNQSYWIDEIFSVDQTSGGYGHLLDVGWSEVHTPLWTTLLWAWQHAGGSHTAWTRLLSVLIGLATIVVAELSLRRTSVSVLGRRLAVALTAAGGFGIVYAQEVRPYALLLLGATGLTAATLTRLDDLRAQIPTSWRRAAPWFGWALLTATTHLLGAVLVGVVTLVLAGATRRRGGARPALGELALGLVALLPQLAWIALGSLRSGFAQGTTWIVAPTPGSVWELLTTSFGAGGLTPHSDGFPFTSPAGVAVVLVVLAGAVVLRARGRRPAPPGDPGTEAADTDLRSGLLLLAMAAATILLTYLVSQWVHLWTLRNMIVVVPPLTWGVAWVAAALPRTPAGRRGVAAALLVAMLVSLGPVARDLQQPYKNDWRSLIRYLEQVRSEDPTATFSVFGSDPAGAIVAADGDASAAARQRLDARMDWHPRDVASIADLHRIPGRQVVFYHGGVGRPRLPEVERALLEQLGDPRCSPVPIYGFVVVSCP